jgi:hypothetical protein
MRTLASQLLLGAGAAIAVVAVSCSPKAANESADAAKTANVASDTATAAADGVTAAVDASTVTADAGADALVVEPEALEALSKMSAYLRTLKSFEIDADTTADTVLDNGQLVQVGGKATYRVRRPDAFRLAVDTDRKQRTLYYDGKMMTLYSPRMKFYAQVEAPPTIKEAAAMIEDKYGFELPLADLFYWGSEDASTDDITSAMHVGLAKVEGVDCSQYAFRQGDVDWQIFIQTGDKPLPRKIVIATRSDEARPQFTAVMNWKENPSFNDATFSFKPTPDARRIQIVPVQS